VHCDSHARLDIALHRHVDPVVDPVPAAVDPGRDIPLGGDDPLRSVPQSRVLDFRKFLDDGSEPRLGVKRLQLLEFQAEPGKSYSYPNVGYSLLGAGNHYGYGGSIGKTRVGNRVWAHNGSNGVSCADSRIYPGDRFVLVLATNANGLRYMSELSSVARAVLPVSKRRGFWNRTAQTRLN